MKTGLIGLLVAGLLAAPMTEATVVYYTFTATDGHFGSFSYDDTNTTLEPGPPPPLDDPGSSSRWYSAISVNIDGVYLASPVIGIYNNLSYDTYDCVVASSVVSVYPGLELCASPPTLFSSQALSEANYRQLSDFTCTWCNGLIVAAWGPVFPILTLTFAVPEPAALALLGIGLAGFGFSRRRKQ